MAAFLVLQRLQERTIKMPPTFYESSFIFEEGEQAPEHIEGWAREADQDPGKWWLQGYDTFSSEDYVLAINIDDAETAHFLARARLRELERSQPSIHSGGQGYFGIQDRVYVKHPGQPRWLR